MMSKKMKIAWVIITIIVMVSMVLSMVMYGF